MIPDPFRKRTLPWKPFIRAFVVLSGLFVMAPPAQATHFRFGQNSWTRGTRNDVTFAFQQAWRLSADDDLFIDFGDGSPLDLGPQVVIGTFSDLAGEQYLIESHATPHSYASEGPFLASAESCCRISSLVNAGDASERIETIVDLRNGNLGSPVSSVPVIVQFPAGQAYSFPLPVADPDGDPVTCRMATFGESLIPAVAQAGANVLTVSPSCVLSWDTTGTVVGQKYAAQVILEESHMGNPGKVALDFIIEIASTVGASPVCSGISGNHIVNVGQTFTGNLTGTDPDGDDLTIAHLGLPPGASLTPPAGTTQPEPFAASFSWSPQASDAGTAHAVTVLYTDPSGRQGTCGFSLNVPNSVCGNGTTEPPFEQCDDGNTDNGDGCDANCQNEVATPCGDGAVGAGEECDAGAANSTTTCGCDATCHYPVAGTSCSDGDACTQTDACDGQGACAGSNPVLCQPVDGCHDAGTCNPQSGVCSAGAFAACTFDVARDSFLRSSSDGTNEGANPSLVVRRNGTNRPVVEFDLSGIDTTGLSQATLVLSVKDNTENWSPGGRAVEVHPLYASFAEGNGKNLDVPVGQRTRGSGPGATWECAADAQISNLRADCAPQWNGGTYGPATDSVVHTNSTSGEVRLDVTADVQAGWRGWLVKKADERLAGRVDYYSREGAAAAGNPGLAPRLELE